MQSSSSSILIPSQRSCNKKSTSPIAKVLLIIAEGFGKQRVSRVKSAKGALSLIHIYKALHPSGVGARLTTKINVNLGVSRDWKDVDMEYEKVRSAVEMGAEAIMDLSSYGDTRSFRRKLTADCPAMILSLIHI